MRAPGGGLRLVVVARLEDAKLASKLLPLQGLPGIDEIVVVRRTPLPLSGVRSACPPFRGRLTSWSAEPWRLALALTEAARAPERTLVVSFFLMPHGLIAEWTRKLLHVPTVPVLIGDEDLERAETSPFFRAALLAAHAVGVRGPRSARRVAALGVPEPRIFCPPNVYDASTFVAAGTGPRDVDVVFAGAFYRSKRLDVLLEAAARLRVRSPDLRVVLVGDGEERAALEAQRAKLGLTSNVTFTGRLPAAGVASWLQRARLFVMTSEQEGLPTAMIEALTAGTPVVIGDIGDVADVAHHGENAWLVRDRSPESFAAAIGRLLEDEPLRQRLAAGAADSRGRFERDYSLEAARQAWRPVLQALHPHPA
jgi:glycosyltransferase involved in cell wall biosynthesis